MPEEQATTPAMPPEPTATDAPALESVPAPALDAVTVTPPPPAPENPTPPSDVPVTAQDAQPVPPPPPPQPVTSAPSPVLPPAPAPHFGRYSVAEAKALATDAKRSRVQKMLDRIMAAVGKRGSINNDETEQLLHVSNRTATNYLSRLFKSGLLTRMGSNRRIRYEKK